MTTPIINFHVKFAYLISELRPFRRIVTYILRLINTRTYLLT